MTCTFSYIENTYLPQRTKEELNNRAFSIISRLKATPYFTQENQRLYFKKNFFAEAQNLVGQLNKEYPSKQGIQTLQILSKPMERGEKFQRKYIDVNVIRSYFTNDEFNDFNKPSTDFINEEGDSDTSDYNEFDNSFTVNRIVDKANKEYRERVSKEPQLNIQFSLSSDIQETTDYIKPGVAELFESNPTLANAVYETLKFNLYELPIIDTENIISFEGTKGAAQYDKTNNQIKVNRNFLKKKFEEKAWTKPRKLIETLHGKIIESYAQALPENQFKTYKEWEQFVINHEYQHSLYSRQDFDKEFPNKTKGDYESEINKRALNQIALQKQQAQIIYSQYLDQIFPDSKVTEMDNTLYNSILNQLEQENKIEKDCTGGNLKAKDGIRTKFTKGSQWEVVKDLKGYPSHSQGGVDIKIGKNGFSFTRDNSVIEAKHGLVLSNNFENPIEFEAISKVLSQRNKHLNWVDRGLNPDKYPKIDNQDGTFSTHRLAYSTGDNGEAYVYPTIIQNDKGELEQLDDNAAWEYAKKTKTAMTVPNVKLAEYYSKNGLIKH